MPDLQPNTSIYGLVKPPPNSFGNMSISDLVGLAQQVGKYQTQRAMSDALTGSQDPNNPSLTDFGAAARTFGSDPRSTMKTPADVAAFSAAGGAQQDFQQKKLSAAAGLLTQVLNLGPKASVDDFNRVAPALAGLGIPQRDIMSVYQGPSSGPDFIKNLQLLRNAWGGEQYTEVPGYGGIPTNVPAGAAALQSRGVGGETPGIPSAGQSPLYNTDLAASANYKREVQPLEQAIPALARLGQTGTFPGADELNNVKTFLVGIGADKALGIDVSKVKDFTEAKKYLVDWANMNSAGGTNDRLAATFASNPNTSMNNAAAIDVAKTALSIRRMKQAQVMEFQGSGLPQSAYPVWASQWNAQQDPRAYGFDLLSSDQKQKLVKQMSPADYQRFKESLAVAEHWQLNSPNYDWNNERKPNAAQ